MTFLHAWAAGFAGIAPVIVLLYLLKLKRRSLPVSTLLFWQRIFQENRRRAFFQRLRHLFSLLLHLLIFALLLAALARPTFDRQIRDGASTVLVLDTRARMQATEPGGRTRFDLALAEARNAIHDAGALRQMALLTTDRTPRVVSPFTDDEKALREALATTTVTDASGELDAALHLASDLLASRRGERQIIVYTDRVPETGAASLKVPVDYVAVGSSRDNLAITRFATRTVPNSPQTSEILLEVANFGRSPAKTNVELAYDGRLLDVKPLTIEPGGRASRIFPTVPRPGRTSRGWLTARLDTSDALASDNVAYAVLPVDPPKRVLLVTKANWFLEKLLGADQSITFELVTPDAFSPSLGSKFDAVILDDFVPAGFDWTTAEGNYFFIRQTPFNAPGPLIDQPLITELDPRHPALRLVNLQNITLLHAATLAVPANSDWQWQSPIRSFDHPLMITGEHHGSPRRLAALALDIGDSDLPLRIAFPLLISNTLHWLAGEESTPILSRRAGDSIPLTAGETIPLDPQTPWKKPATSPAVTHDIFEPLSNGFYQVQTPQGSHWLAVNTFSDSESDLRLPQVPASARPSLPGVSFARLTSWPLWQYLAAAALLLFALEWWLFHRRRTE